MSKTKIASFNLSRLVLTDEHWFVKRAKSATNPSSSGGNLAVIFLWYLTRVHNVFSTVRDTNANARPGCGVNRGKLQSNFSLTAAKSDRACCLMEWNDDRRTTFRKLKTRFYQPISEDRIIGKSA
jgi:hypothetical protein